MTTKNEVRFHVPDMSCNHCVETISKAIQSAIAGAQVKADLTHHIVTVMGTNDAEQVAQIITRQDYTCQLL